VPGEGYLEPKNWELAMLAPRVLLSVVLTFPLLTCTPGGDGGRLQPPKARIEPTSLVTHGHERIDNYYWLRNRDDPEVLAYLQAENEYTAASMAHTQELQAVLVQEISGRLREDDSSVPSREGDYLYYERFEEGAEYPIYARKQGSMEAQEEIILDANRMGQDQAYFRTGAFEVTKDGQTLAFAVDTVGRNSYTIRFKDLNTRDFLPDEIPSVTSNLEWATDNQTLFYANRDPVSLNWHQIFRHTLGANPSRDVLVYEEADPSLGLVVRKTKSGEYLYIRLTQMLSTYEYRVLRADNPTGEFRVVVPREIRSDTWLDHVGDYFILLMKDQAGGSRLVRAPVDRPGPEHWEEVIPNRDDVFLEDAEVFSKHLVVAERSGGLTHLRVLRWDGTEDHIVDFDEPAYAVYIEGNRELDTNLLRFTYSSLTTPTSVYDYNMDTREKILLKRDEVLGGYDPAHYVTDRLSVKARDGTEVPVTVVFRHDTPLDGSSPALLFGLGAYGLSLDPWFNPDLLSLLDRGFVYAIAHVRGGGELGTDWHEAGTVLRKKNTFTDFIDVAEFLIRERYADEDRLFASGHSSGGLLIGAVVNMRPDLWRGVIADVPFVDIVNTMLDEDIPLVAGEDTEWGDPRIKEHYEYMLSYSPYDQVSAQDYPNILVRAAYPDSQVQYWEAAKWVAKLRALKTDENRLLLNMSMRGAHSGPSGRAQRGADIAFEFAFLLDLAGLDHVDGRLEQDP
jgi:oligopeptidase B